ncbi:hypothetical protein J6590_103036 [Homalodisca vitripennis]|nr:hypothetical protein J6590_103036 [Homalodisca vitripennis]
MPYLTYIINGGILRFFVFADDDIIENLYAFFKITATMLMKRHQITTASVIVCCNLRHNTDLAMFPSLRVS